MAQKPVIRESNSGCRVSLYKTKLQNGRQRFLAEANFADGSKFLMDHWNLSSLERIVHEVIPIAQMAKDWSKKTFTPCC